MWIKWTLIHIRKKKQICDVAFNTLQRDLLVGAFQSVSDLGTYIRLQSVPFVHHLWNTCDILFSKNAAVGTSAISASASIFSCQRRWDLATALEGAAYLWSANALIGYAQRKHQRSFTPTHSASSPHTAATEAEVEVNLKKILKIATFSPLTGWAVIWMNE